MQYTITSISLRRVAAVASLLGVAGAIACSGDATGNDAGPASQLSFAATSSTSASAAIAPVTVGGHTLDLTTATVTLSRAELKRVRTDACPGDNDEGEDDDHPRDTLSTAACHELKVGPLTVDLPLSGNVVTVPANAIPAGTFRELELRVTQVELKGTFDGTAFDVTIPVRVHTEVEFATPIVVTEGAPTSITVAVPVGTWLVNADGSLVDPNKIGTTPSLLAQVKNRIAASLRAFEDRDHDGHDDHGGDRGHSGPG